MVFKGQRSVPLLGLKVMIRRQSIQHPGYKQGTVNAAKHWDVFCFTLGI